MRIKEQEICLTLQEHDDDDEYITNPQFSHFFKCTRFVHFIINNVQKKISHASVQVQVYTIMIYSTATSFINNGCVCTRNKPRCKNIRDIPKLEVQKNE